jgi:hypothetical protein
VEAIRPVRGGEQRQARAHEIAGFLRDQLDLHLKLVDDVERELR